jgi:hypothetical protein
VTGNEEKGRDNFVARHFLTDSLAHFHCKVCLPLSNQQANSQHCPKGKQTNTTSLK